MVDCHQSMTAPVSITERTIVYPAGRLFNLTRRNIKIVFVHIHALGPKGCKGIAEDQ
jgi:hypothetical protein